LTKLQRQFFAKRPATDRLHSQFHRGKISKALNGKLFVAQLLQRQPAREYYSRALLRLHESAIGNPGSRRSAILPLSLLLTIGVASTFPSIQDWPHSRYRCCGVAHISRICKFGS